MYFFIITLEQFIDSVESKLSLLRINVLQLYIFHTLTHIIFKQMMLFLHNSHQEMNKA